MCWLIWNQEASGNPKSKRAKDCKSSPLEGGLEGVEVKTGWKEFE